MKQLTLVFLLPEIACIGIIISGAILYRFFFLRSLAIKIHFLCSYWAFLVSSIQLGVNTNITVIPKLNEKAQKICYYASYLGALAGVIIIIQSKFVANLFSLNEELISITTIQGVLLLIGFATVGISISHLILKSITK